MPAPLQAGAASTPQDMARETRKRVVKLCSSIISDKHADQMVKEEAMLLRCDLNEVDAEDE